ncbi:thioesterase II family protein [Streptomyces caeni]|uniref:thioesterase II family protein n=1 Tax=Streptomyces caeni TaxID=2307231 RepID=UPI0036D2EF0B
MDPGPIHPDLRDLVLPALLADFTIATGYAPRPGVPLPFPVYACVGDADPDVDATSVRGRAEPAPHGFDLRVLPGDHFCLVQQRAALIQDMSSRLNRLLHP